MARVTRIVGIVLPPAPDHLGVWELQVAQAVAEGWCASCLRVESLTPISVDGRGHRHYKDVCRWCGNWRREHGELPPLRVVALRADGRPVTVAAATKGGS